MEKMRQWSILTAVGVVAVLAAGWFLLVSPQRSHAADLRTQAATQQTSNNSLQSRVGQLQEQKKGLPAQQQKLTQIAAKVPDNPALPVLIRQLSAAAQGAGVDLVSMAPSAPQLVASSAPTTVTPATGTAPAAPGAAAATSTSPLAQIQLTVNVQGSYYNIESFFRSVEKLSRAMLVQQWTLSPLSGAGAATTTGSSAAGTGSSASVKPAGTLNATLTAVVFESPLVIPAQTAPVAPVAPAQ